MGDERFSQAGQLLADESHRSWIPAATTGNTTTLLFRFPLRSDARTTASSTRQVDN